MLINSYWFFIFIGCCFTSMKELQIKNIDSFVKLLKGSEKDQVQATKSILEDLTILIETKNHIPWSWSIYFIPLLKNILSKTKNQELKLVCLEIFWKFSLEKKMCRGLDDFQIFLDLLKDKNDEILHFTFKILKGSLELGDWESSFRIPIEYFNDLISLYYKYQEDEIREYITLFLILIEPKSLTKPHLKIYIPILNQLLDQFHKKPIQASMIQKIRNIFHKNNDVSIFIETGIVKKHITLLSNHSNFLLISECLTSILYITQMDEQGIHYEEFNGWGLLEHLKNLYVYSNGNDRIMLRNNSLVKNLILNILFEVINDSSLKVLVDLKFFENLILIGYGNYRDNISRFTRNSFKFLKKVLTIASQKQTEYLVSLGYFEWMINHFNYFFKEVYNTSSILLYCLDTILNKVEDPTFLILHLIDIDFMTFMKSIDDIEHSSIIQKIENHIKNFKEIDQWKFE